jgi:TonB family protein
VRRATALAILTGFALAPHTATEAQQLPGDEMLGHGISSVVDALGMPQDVESLDSGHTWVWHTPRAFLRIITDDAMTVKAIDDRPLAPGERLAHVELFGYTKALADSERGTSDLSGPDFRTYNLGDGHVLELFFDDSGKLTHAVFGDRGYVARLGFVPADREMLRVLQYSAPKIRRTPAALTIAPMTVVRCEIGKDGRAFAVTVVVSSHNAGLDARALAFARQTSWTPAKFDNVPVKSVAFWMVR